MISYEVPLILSLLGVVMLSGSLSLTDVVRAQGDTIWTWYFLPQLPMFVTFYISGIAEVKRVPFDLPEGESELVAGFFVEYSSMTFALFFLGEYASMILMSALTSILFLGGWLPPVAAEPFTWIPGPVWFALKIALVAFFFLWVRATFPRFRYDQLMRLGWKVFLPISLFMVVAVAFVLQITGWAPTRF